MGRVLVIGAGGVSTVAVKKIAMNADVFTDIMAVSYTHLTLPTKLEV